MLAVHSSSTDTNLLIWLSPRTPFSSRGVWIGKVWSGGVWSTLCEGFCRESFCYKGRAVTWSLVCELEFVFVLQGRRRHRVRVHDEQQLRSGVVPQEVVEVNIRLSSPRPSSGGKRQTTSRWRVEQGRHVAFATVSRHGGLLLEDEYGGKWVGIWPVLELKSLPYNEPRRNGQVLVERDLVFCHCTAQAPLECVRRS